MNEPRATRSATVILVDTSVADMYDRSNTLAYVEAKAMDTFTFGGYEVDEIEILNADKAFDDRQASNWGSGEHIAFQVIARTTFVTAE
jgi:hypothetical protein